jgi:hypothetical protein
MGITDKDGLLNTYEFQAGIDCDWLILGVRNYNDV